jgi:hypothetical protein
MFRTQKRCATILEVNLRLTVSRPVCLGIRHSSGTRDQFFFLLEISFRRCGFVICSALSDEKTGVIYCTIASGPCQSNHSWVEVPQNSGHILLSHLRLPQPGMPGPRIYMQHIPPFCRLLRLAGLRWRYSNPPPHESAIFLQID